MVPEKELRLHQMSYFLLHLILSGLEWPPNVIYTYQISEGKQF